MDEVIGHAHAGATWSQAPEATIVELVEGACRRDPDRPLLIFEDGLILTRRDLAARAESFAAALGERVVPGERVAIVLCGANTDPADLA